MMSIKRSCILLAMLLATGCATTGDYLGDARTTTRVKTAIYNEPELKVMSIHVATDGGVVTLSGTVKSKTERTKAVQVARKVEGVKQVKNDLAIGQ
jgi:osmotically-inducible protein OsmY